MIDTKKFKEFLQNHQLRSGPELFTECMTMHGVPLYRSSQKKVPLRLNEPFWTEFLSLERLLIWERDQKAFMVYNPSNGLWEEESPQAIKLRLSDLIEQSDSQWPDCHEICRLNTEGGRSAIVELLRGKVEQRDFFANRPPAIHCANCMIEPNGSKIIPKPFDPKYRSRNQLTVPYQPGAECPDFTDKLLKPSLTAEDLKLVQKMMGLILLGRNRPQRIFLLEGEPNTGKTTLGLIVVGLIGSWNYAELRTEHLDKRFEMSRLLGKTLVFGPDVKSDFLQTPGAYRLKSIVGGDPMNAEKKNSNGSFPFPGDLNALITSNSRLLVRLQRDMPAWQRRLVSIFFTGKGPAQRIDGYAQVLIRKEGPGILNWGLEGLLAYEPDHCQRGDVFLSDEQSRRVTQLLTESDGLRRFLERELVITDNANVTSEEIMQAYARYAKAHNWRTLSLQLLQTQTADLMMELYGISQSHNVSRPKLDDEGQEYRDSHGNTKKVNVRGYRGVRIRRENETDR